jgi:hypothetical protein
LQTEAPFDADEAEAISIEINGPAIRHAATGAPCR